MARQLAERGYGVRLVARSEDRLLANNAGFGTYKAFAEIPRERLLEEVRVNTEAVADLTAR